MCIRVKLTLVNARASKMNGPYKNHITNMRVADTLQNALITHYGEVTIWN